MLGRGDAKRQPTLDDIRELSYTRLVLAEGLRLYPQVRAPVAATVSVAVSCLCARCPARWCIRLLLCVPSAIKVS